MAERKVINGFIVERQQDGRIVTIGPAAPASNGPPVIRIPAPRQAVVGDNLDNANTSSQVTNRDVQTQGQMLDNKGKAYRNDAPALRADLLGPTNAPYELNPLDLKAENNERLRYQARTGIPRLHVDRDPFRYLIPDKSSYAKAVADAQKTYRAPSEKWQAAVDERASYTKMAQDVLDALNSGVTTGGITGQVNGAIGGYYNPRVASINAAESIASKANRVPGDIISNFDAKLLLRAAPGMSKPAEFNRAWAVNQIQAGKSLDAFNDFRDAWISTNGSTAGMVGTWKAYAEANPLFAKGKNGKPLIRNGNPVPNANRTPWQTWFKQRAQGVLAKETESQTNAGKARNLVYDPKTGTLRNAD
jgi:hypothetical protein